MKDIAASVENVGKLEIGKLEQRLSVLATISGAAPMIGFLGTVIGMITTFHRMTNEGVEIDSLAGGIMQLQKNQAATCVWKLMAKPWSNTGIFARFPVHDLMRADCSAQQVRILKISVFTSGSPGLTLKNCPPTFLTSSSAIFLMKFMSSIPFSQPTGTCP